MTQQLKVYTTKLFAFERSTLPQTLWTLLEWYVVHALSGMVCLPFESNNVFFYWSPLTVSRTLFLGQDEYSRLSRNASLGVHGYALVFTVASRQSFEQIVRVNNSLLNTLGDAPDVPRVLVGNMKDLVDQRQVHVQVRRSCHDAHVSYYADCEHSTLECVCAYYFYFLKKKKIERIISSSMNFGPQKPN